MAQPATVLLLTPLCWLLAGVAGPEPCRRACFRPMHRALTAPETRPGVPHKRRP